MKRISTIFILLSFFLMVGCMSKLEYKESLNIACDEIAAMSVTAQTSEDVIENDVPMDNWKELICYLNSLKLRENLDFKDENGWTIMLDIRYKEGDIGRVLVLEDVITYNESCYYLEFISIEELMDLCLDN